MQWDKNKGDEQIRAKVQKLLELNTLKYYDYHETKQLVEFIISGHVGNQ